MPITAAARQAMYAQVTDDFPVVLVSFDHPETPGLGEFPFRFASDSEDVVSNGDTYLAAVFSFQPPDQEPGKELVARIAVPGPSINFITAVRSLGAVAPKFEVKIVMASNPDQVLREWKNIVLRNFDANAVGFVAELHFSRLTETPFPGDRYSLSNFPGIF